MGSLKPGQAGRCTSLTVHGHAVVKVVSLGFYSNSGGVSEVERNERESDGRTDGRMDGIRFRKTRVDLLSKQDNSD